MNERKKYTEYIELLLEKIRYPSFSGNEEDSKKCLKTFIESHGLSVEEKYNNIWIKNRYYDDAKPTILLNSHLDTVRPSSGYTLDPFSPAIRDGKLYGLGSNDAGGALVSLLATFLHYYDRKEISWNLIFAATAEEENSGDRGIECVLPELGNIELGIVGEPTSMEMAIAEKGLMVIEGYYSGRSGHAGRGEGENAIYKALHDIAWFRDYKFEKESDLLGPVHMSVTRIEAGTNHNVTPDLCKIVVDVRCNDCYSLDEILQILEKETEGELKPRSRRLQPSKIDPDHPVVKAGKALGMETYGSPTLSDQSLMPFPSLKLGPGDSSRSHTADEFIFVEQIEKGIEMYIRLFEEIEHVTLTNSIRNETVG